MNLTNSFINATNIQGIQLAFTHVFTYGRTSDANNQKECQNNINIRRIIYKEANLFYSFHKSSLIRTFALQTVSLPKPAYPGSSARIPGPISPHTRTQIKKQPFPLKIARNTKCFQRLKQLKNKHYLYIKSLKRIVLLKKRVEDGRQRWKINGLKTLSSTLLNYR